MSARLPAIGQLFDRNAISPFAIQNPDTPRE